jgi:hypothetical protein
MIESQLVIAQPTQLKIMKATSAGFTIARATTHGIDEPCVRAYFAFLNDGEFAAAASLFATQGYIQPPFDRIVQGREAIAAYLAQETKGMRFCPQSGQPLPSPDEGKQFEIQGHVEIDCFTFNVKWLVKLNREKKIVAMNVKLLDSLSRLLKFNQAVRR